MTALETHAANSIERMGGRMLTTFGMTNAPAYIVLTPYGASIFLTIKSTDTDLKPAQRRVIDSLLAMHQHVCVTHGKAGLDAFLDDLRHCLASSGEYWDKDDWTELGE